MLKIVGYPASLILTLALTIISYETYISMPKTRDLYNLVYHGSRLKRPETSFEFLVVPALVMLTINIIIIVKCERSRDANYLSNSRGIAIACIAYLGFAVMTAYRINSVQQFIS